MATRAAAARLLGVLARTAGRPSAKIASHLARVRSASALFVCLQQTADQHLFSAPASRVATSKLLEAVLRALSTIWRLMGPLAGLGSLRCGAGPGPYIPVWGDEENDSLPAVARRPAKGKQPPVAWTPGFYPWVGPEDPSKPDQSQREWMLMRCMLVGQLDTYVFPANLRLLLSCVFLGDPILVTRTDSGGDYRGALPAARLPHSPCTKTREYACAIVADVIVSRFDNELGLEVNAARLFRTREDLASRYGLGLDDPQARLSGWPAACCDELPLRLPRNKDESMMLRTYILSFDPSLCSLFPDTYSDPCAVASDGKAGSKRKLPSDSEPSDRPTQHPKRAERSGSPIAAVRENEHLPIPDVPLPDAEPLTALCKWIQANLPVLHESPVRFPHHLPAAGAYAHAHRQLQDALLEIIVSLLASLHDCSQWRLSSRAEVVLLETLRTLLVQYRAPVDEEGNFHPWSCSSYHWYVSSKDHAQRPG